MSLLTLHAGPTALRRIQTEGLSPDMVTAIFGASGSAKWLAISGLDRYIFTKWLPQRKTASPITLFGTSIGAFKLAAAAQADPGAAIDRLVTAYTSQAYRGAITPEQISASTRTLITGLLGSDNAGAREILANPAYRFACGAVRCHGRLNSTNIGAQKRAMASGFFKTLRHQYIADYERTLFVDPRLADNVFEAQDDYPARLQPLTEDNFAKALTASGSIPVYMDGIRFDDDPDHLYRDGGLLDYHPVPSRLMRPSQDLILYPHFYPYVIGRWFEKFMPWRKCDGRALDNTLLIAPSRTFVRSLPGKRIPDRQDFVTYAKKEEERIDRWNISIALSAELGAQFAELCQSGRIADHIQPI